MRKSVWILGAGASIGHMKGNFPSIYDFFSFARDITYHSFVSQVTEDKYYQLGNYIKELWGKSIFDENSKIDIEKVMTHLDIQLSHQQSSKLINIKESLYEIISDILLQLPKKGPKQSEYNSFIKKLNSEDTIITFNWDLLLDNILDREKILEKNMTTKPPQYFNFNQFCTSGYINKPYSSYNQFNGFYLKLHGSVDWFSCNNNSCRAYGRVFPLLSFSSEMFCSECHERVINTLIPPVLYKEYQKYPFINRLWNTALNEITYADKLIIWGYSFPPTDFYTIWLLKAISLIDSIIIINPDCIKKGKKVTWNYSYLKPIFELFRPIIKNNNIIFYENFESYNKELLITKLYNLSNPKLN